MKAMIIEDFGAPAVFQLKEIEKPVVQPGSVLIKVEATSVNPIDTKIRAGVVLAAAPEFPAILQGDVAGTIVEIGEGVEKFAVGDKVFGCAGGFKGTYGGALAEYMLADVRLLAHKPKNISMAQAAALPLVSITAWEALMERGRVTKDDTILIHGATGGVGHIALQLAAITNDHVYTTVSSNEKGKIAQTFGAKTIINYREENVQSYVEKYTDGEGFSIVFDTVGGNNLDASFHAAAVNGTVLTIAARSTHDLSPLHAKGLSLHVTFMLLKILQVSARKDHGIILEKIAKLVEEDKIKPLLDTNQFSFEEVAEAHAYLESGKAIGKVVLTNNW